MGEQLSGWSFAHLGHADVWSAHPNRFGLFIGYFGGCSVGLKGSPSRSEQQRLSSPDPSNPQNFGGDELLKSEKSVLTHYTLFHNGNIVLIKQNCFGPI